MWCWGRNSEGQLGVGDSASRCAPSAVAGSFGQVALGGSASCALSTDGALFCWGNKDNDRLAADLRGMERPTSPLAVQVGRTWESISYGNSHGCVIDAQRRLHCWGANGSGQLGVASVLDSTPDPVVLGSEFRQVSAGSSHTCALQDTVEGTVVLCWGRNDFGQVGMDSGGAAVQSPVRVGDRADWEFIAAGAEHSCGLRDGGRLFCWGSNESGRLGVPVGPEQVLGITEVMTGTRFRDVDIGTDHACAIAENGVLWCWGEGSPRLGFSSPTPVSPPKAVVLE